MSDDLVKQLRKIGERVPVPCPDGIKGCLVFHFRVETDPTCAEAADRIEALEAEVERLREALGWFLNDSRFVVQVGGNPYVVPQMIEAARAALGEKQ